MIPDTAEKHMMQVTQCQGKELQAHKERLKKSHRTSK